MLKSRARAAILPGATSTSSWTGAASLLLAGLQPPAACATRATRGWRLQSQLREPRPFQAQFLDTGRGVHARLWRANREDDVRRQFLGRTVRVNLLALLLDGPYGEDKAPLVSALHAGCLFSPQ